MKRALAARAADTYVLASSKKIGTAFRFRVLPRREEISGLITDEKPHDPVIEQHGARGRSPGGRLTAVDPTAGRSVVRTPGPPGRRPRPGGHCGYAYGSGTDWSSAAGMAGS